MAIRAMVLALALALALSACGYHLRGANAVPDELKQAYLEGASLPLREHLLKTVYPKDGRFAFSPQQAKFVIRVFNERAGNRPLALNERGRTNEMQLFYRLDYELARPDDTVLLERQHLEVKRQFFYRQEDIIAMHNEEAIVRDEMLEQAAASIVSRARIVLEAGR